MLRTAVKSHQEPALIPSSSYNMIGNLDVLEKPDRDPAKCKQTFYTRRLPSTVLLICFLLTLFIAKTVRDALNQSRAPHPFLYAQGTLDEVEDLSSVVRPLVNENQKFDIYVTVWVRNPGTPRSVYWDDEHPIFSDTVFRGVTLMDEHVHAQINLSIPVESFEGVEVKADDLRAGFTLVPQSPSLLDYMTTFNSWNGPPHTSLHPKDLDHDMKAYYRSRAIESYGISTPLVDFHNISCVPPQSPKRDESSGTSDAEGLKDEEDRLPSKPHPYVVTRTDLRVARMTKLYDARAYESFHTKLKYVPELNGCPPDLIFPKEAEKCVRTFALRGNAETYFELGVPDETTGEKKIQLAYAPFLDVNKRSWGPLDLEYIPVNQGNCAGKHSDTPTYLNVTWNLAYSGSTPEKLLFAEILSSLHEYDVNGTEFRKALVQSEAATLHRTHGLKYSRDAHYFRFFVLSYLVALLSRFIQTPLNILYWYTRTTTVGISIPGSVLVATSYMLFFISDLWMDGAFNSNQSVITRFLAFVREAYWSLLLSLLILKRILRIYFVKAYPFVKMRPASHAERASSRFETTGKTSLFIAILICSMGFHLYEPLRNYSLIARIGPTRDPLPAHARPMIAINVYMANPLMRAGNAYQLILNSRNRTFAGRYKLVVWVEVITVIADVTTYVPWVVGKLVLRNEYALWDLVRVLFSVVWVVQAFLYPKVPQDVVEDKDGI